MKRYLYLIFFLSFFHNIWSFDIGVESGLSFFNYAEVGVNNKDDLYSVSSISLGGFYRDKMSFFDYKISLKTEFPFLLNVTDALGPDNTNYMETLFGVGFNLQYLLLYPIFYKNFTISPGVGLNYDFLFFIDRPPGMLDSYLYSVFGSGPAIECLYNINGNLDIIFTTVYIFDFFPLSLREGEFLWSNNLSFTLGFLIL